MDFFWHQVRVSVFYILFLCSLQCNFVQMSSKYGWSQMYHVKTSENPASLFDAAFFFPRKALWLPIYESLNIWPISNKILTQKQRESFNKMAWADDKSGKESLFFFLFNPLTTPFFFFFWTRIGMTSKMLLCYCIELFCAVYGWRQASHSVKQLCCCLQHKRTIQGELTWHLSITP